MTEAKIRILFVEDDPAGRMVIERFLKREKLPYDCVVAGSLEEARSMFKKCQCDVVVSDYTLDKATPFDISAVNREPPAVIITGTGDEAVVVKAMKSGAYDYLIKDPEGNHLKALSITVENALARKKAEAALQRYQRHLEELVKERTTELETEIAERKRAEEALRTSEKRSRALLNATCETLILIDRQGIVLACNETAAEEFKLKAEEMVGVDLFKCMPPHVANARKAHFKEVLKTGEASSFIDKIRNRVLNNHVYPLRGDGREMAGAAIFSQDISEHKRLEEQLLQSQKLEAIGSLAGGIAHDFNNLLTTIIGNTDLVLRDLDPKNPLYEILDEIKTAGEKAASVTRQLLAFSRKQIIKPEMLDLNEEIQDMERILSRVIGEDIQFKTVLAQELKHVFADPGQINQVVMNLAINAREAMPKGGKLTIETANRYLDKEYFSRHGLVVESGSYVMIAVSDTGIGMDEEIAAHIFEPFFTTKKRERGTGLGLSTVYGIAKQSRGFVWVYSEPKIGTTFRVYLPAITEKCEKPQVKKRPPPVKGGTETILVVEDDYTVRGIIHKILKRHQYVVLAAADSLEALEILKNKSRPIHMLITDVVMPGMSGGDLAKEAARLQPDIKVLYMSGYTDDTIVRHGILDRGVNFIEKPFLPEAFIRMVRGILDGTVDQTEQGVKGRIIPP